MVALTVFIDNNFNFSYFKETFASCIYCVAVKCNNNSIHKNAAIV